jgi:hypothetical protein
VHRKTGTSNTIQRAEQQDKKKKKPIESQRVIIDGAAVLQGKGTRHKKKKDFTGRGCGKEGRACARTRFSVGDDDCSCVGLFAFFFADEKFD